MAELATIARPYAEALFKATRSSSDLPSLLAQVQALAAVAADPQLRQFADNPKVSDDQVFEVLSSAAGVSLTEACKNFLRTVIDNGRLAALPDMAAQFQTLVNAGSGISQATIYSAYPIEPEPLSDIVALLEKRFGRKLDASVALEPELIGGIRVVVGDEVLDTSVRARLQQMKLALTA